MSQTPSLSLDGLDAADARALFIGWQIQPVAVVLEALADQLRALRRIAGAPPALRAEFRAAAYLTVATTLCLRNEPLLRPLADHLAQTARDASPGVRARVVHNVARECVEIVVLRADGQPLLSGAAHAGTSATTVDLGASVEREIAGHRGGA